MDGITPNATDRLFELEIEKEKTRRILIKVLLITVPIVLTIAVGMELYFEACNTVLERIWSVIGPVIGGLTVYYFGFKKKKDELSNTLKELLKQIEKTV